MTEIVTPLYLALACLFVGLTLAARPGLDASLLPSERTTMYGTVGEWSSALACVCIALVPMVGRALLMASTLLLWLSFMVMCLRVRGWHRPLTRRYLMAFAWAVSAAVLGMLALFLLGASVPLRAAYQGGLSLMLLAAIALELRQVYRLRPSGQLLLMILSVLGQTVVVAFWTALLVSGETQRMLVFSQLFAEAELAFAMRLFVVSFLALMYIGANGYGLERMVALKAAAIDAKEKTEGLNAQLQQALLEKQEMLQALSFAVRSQNMPAIMSSLSHEINQPLGAIRLNADHLMATKSGMTEPERQHVLQQLVACSETATQVVRDYRRFFEANRAPHSPVELTALLSDLERGFHTEISNAQVQASWYLGEPVQILGDAVQLETALVGAMQYMLYRHGGAQRRLWVRVSCAHGQVQIAWLDDGPTLSRAQFDRAFVRDRQDGVTQFNQSLWLCRSIVEHHGGAMDVLQDNEFTGISLQLPVMRGVI